MISMADLHKSIPIEEVDRLCDVENFDHLVLALRIADMAHDAPAEWSIKTAFAMGRRYEAESGNDLSS